MQFQKSIKVNAPITDRFDWRIMTYVASKNKIYQKNSEDHLCVTDFFINIDSMLDNLEKSAENEFRPIKLWRCMKSVHDSVLLMGVNSWQLVTNFVKKIDCEETIYFFFWNMDKIRQLNVSSVRLQIPGADGKTFQIVIPSNGVNNSSIPVAQSSNLQKIKDSFLVFLFNLFVYSKSEYTLKSVSVSVRPSVRLSNNSRKDDPNELKFCT